MVLASLCPSVRARFRGVSLASAALLGCTTVRSPVCTIAPEIPVQGGRAEPQVELWLESDRPATPEESAQASAQARAALADALSGREPDAPDELLVLRAQGVSRTAAHRNDQHAAVAGMVVGAVVVVAAVVVLLVVSSKGGSGPSLPSPGHASAPASGVAHGAGAAGGAVAAPRPPPLPTFRGAPPPVPVRPASLPTPPRVPPAVPARVPPPPVAPRPGYPPHPGGAPEATVGVFVSVEVPVAPAVPEPPEGYQQAQPPPQRPPELDEAADATALVPPPAEDAAPELDRVVLPLPQPLALDERSFFAGDMVSLEAIVVDRATGLPRWRKVLQRGADPRDRKAMKAAVDDLLREGGWAPMY